jgi:hypothetical protein
MGLEADIRALLDEAAEAAQSTAMRSGTGLSAIDANLRALVGISNVHAEVLIRLARELDELRAASAGTEEG